MKRNHKNIWSACLATVKNSADINVEALNCVFLLNLYACLINSYLIPQYGFEL